MRYLRTSKLLTTIILSAAFLTPFVALQTAQAQRRGSLRQYPLLENAAYNHTSSSGILGGYGWFW